MLAERPWEGLPPELAPAMRPGLGALAEEMIETIRADRARLRAAARGRVRGGRARGRRGRAVAVPRRRSRRATPGRCRRASCTPTSAAARRARAAASRRCWPPTGSARAWRGGARPSGRASSGWTTRCRRCWRSRSSPTWTSCRRSPPRASRASSRPPRASSTAAAAALARLLVQSPPADPAAVELAAREARVELPQTLAAAVWSEEDHAASRLPLGSLVDGAFALIPDPDAPGRRAEIARAFRSAAALGPTVPWRDAARSARRAAEALRLVEADGLVFADDHLTTLLLEHDPSLIAELAERRLAPLADATPAQRERLLETLGAWLLHHGSVPEVARRDPRPPADRALPAQPAARAVRSRRPRGALRAAACHPRTRSRPRVVAPMSKTAALQPVPSSA